MITSRNLSFIDWTLRDIAPSPPSQEVLRYFALVRWFALITVGAPIQLWFIPTFAERSYQPDVMATIETVFWVIYAFYATFNGLLTSVAYGDFGEREATLANIANTGCIITECAVINLTGYSVGSLALLQPTLGIMPLVFYRVFLGYRIAVIGFLAIFGTFNFIGALEIMHLVPISPAFEAASNHPYYSRPILGWGQIWLATSQGFLFFTLINFITNQRGHLHRYITEYVLLRYLPESMVKRAAAGELSLEGKPEKREVTILFTDLVGFTTLTRSLGAEATAEILDKFLGGVADAAHQLGGTVDKFVGDCVMVVFGAPESMTLAQQTDRAVQLGFRINEVIARLPQEHGLSARVGINTGEAVVGNFGSKTRSDYTVIGHAVNLAARLESASTPGRILVGPETVVHLPERWIREPYKPLFLKGIDEPVAAFWVYRRPED
ncbi:MAG: adenylate/guanylate cyclase domain-containing protein [Myxococcota bacterium]|nr:adenylate/guanylate cyclase domain-containing protein [Myxococcota bacterium]